MTRWITGVIGVLLLVAGVLGLTGILVSDGKLLGLFAVNDWDNLAYLAGGVLGLGAFYLGGSLPRIFLFLFGIGFIALAAMGIFYGEGILMGSMANNHADVILHSVLGAGALYLASRG